MNFSNPLKVKNTFDGARLQVETFYPISHGMSPVQFDG